MHRTFVFILTLVPFISFATMTEDHTKTLSVQALVLSKQIHFIASKCAVESLDQHALETISQIDEANMLIATKLKITTKYLAEMINDESDLLTRLNTQLETYNCKTMDNKRVLLKLDSELEHTINQLRSAKTLSKPLISEKDRELNAEPALKKTISENFEKARTVALGQLITIDQVPDKYLRQYEPNPSRYWYRFDKGWKFSYIKYIPASRSLMLSMGKSADYKNAMLDRKALFFIDRRDRITAVADVYNEESLIEQLGKAQWFWSGERLRERRR